MAYNAITVGAVDKNGQYYPDSAYNEMLLPTATKPDICAPGDTIYAAGVIAGGTSVATPQITGVVALMMDFNPELILYPETIKAILSANINESYPHFTTEQIYSNDYKKYGAGIVNCACIYTSLRASRFFSAELCSVSAGQTFEYPITLQKMTDNRIVLTFLQGVSLNCDSTTAENIIIYDFPRISFEIWHEDELLASSYNSTNNVLIVSCYTEETVECTIKMTVKNNLETITMLAFAWNYY